MRAPKAGKVRRRRKIVSGELRGPFEPEPHRSAPLLPPQTPGKVHDYGPLPDKIDMPPIPGWLRREKHPAKESPSAGGADVQAVEAA